VLATNRNHSQIQKDNFSEQGLVQNDDSFVLFLLVRVVIQAGEI
jgi:hypothetical protein